MLPLVILLFALLQGAFTETCYYENSFSFGKISYDCTYGCCGSTYVKDCCSYSSSYSSYGTGSNSFVGPLIGIVIGSICGLVIFIALIVVCIKACMKSQTTIVVPAQQQQPTGVVIASTTGQQSFPTGYYNSGAPAYSQGQPLANPPGQVFQPPAPGVPTGK